MKEIHPLFATLSAPEHCGRGKRSTTRARTRVRPLARDRRGVRRRSTIVHAAPIKPVRARRHRLRPDNAWAATLSQASPQSSPSRLCTCSCSTWKGALTTKAAPCSYSCSCSCSTRQGGLTAKVAYLRPPTPALPPPRPASAFGAREPRSTCPDRAGVADWLRARSSPRWTLTGRTFAPRSGRARSPPPLEAGRSTRVGVPGRARPASSRSAERGTATRVGGLPPSRWRPTSGTARRCGVRSPPAVTRRSSPSERGRAVRAGGFSALCRSRITTRLEESSRGRALRPVQPDRA